MNPLAQLGRTAVNALEYARYGGLETGESPSPFEVMATQPVYRLRRYFPDAARAGSRVPVLLVPPLMLATEVWDVSPQISAVTLLHDEGLDPWVVDFGDPARESGGSKRNVTDHVLAVDDAIDRVRAATESDLHIGGYSQGGLFCYQAAAYRGCESVVSIFALGSPVDPKPPGKLPDDVAREISRIGSRILRRTGLPAWALARMFKLTDPVRAVRSEVEYLLALHDRDALLAREGQRRFLAGEGWVAWPGPAIAEILEMVGDERYLRGGLVFGDRTVSLADITCPVLIFVGETDEFGPPKAVRAIARAAPKAEVYEMLLPGGHFGLVVGRQAKKRTWPAIGDWVRWQTQAGELPDGIERLALDAEEQEEDIATAGGVRATVAYGLGLTASLGVAAPGVIAQAGRRAAGSATEFSREAIAQLPHLMRLERLRPRTRISYGQLLDETAQRRPDDVCFLFAGRGHTHAAVKRRVDNVVRGFLALGVRKGEHIGVLMGTRPSALAVVAALNRLGAVAVLMRLGGPVAREAVLGQISRVATDPEHCGEAGAAGVEVLVLGGGSQRRDLGANVVDMEGINPSAVEEPAWYHPNPGRAREVAFILFSGTEEATCANRITNGRWALSALGFASSASLTAADTVYGISPLHHPSGLLLATAGAAGGDARLAMTTKFQAQTFWTEVRRYGVTVVPYTWTMLRALVSAPPHPEERHHPIRLFVGSGMPSNLWRRVLDRFPPAGVLEFYASTHAGAILANVSGRKVGAMGRPLPGTAKIRVAQFDLSARRLVSGADGFASACRADEAGMLLVELDATADPGDCVPLRGVFSRDDAWIATGDLFRRDADGDHWLVDSVEAVISGPGRTVLPRAVGEALSELDAVDLAACYAVERRGDASDMVLAAVTLQPGKTLRTRDVTRALAHLDPAARPDIVHVVDTIPLSSWYRPSLSELRAAGLPKPDVAHPAWKHDPRTCSYKASRRAATAHDRGGTAGRPLNPSSSPYAAAGTQTEDAD